MDIAQLLPLLIIGGSFSLVGAVLYGAWMLGRYRGRDETTPPILEALDVRLTRLEQAALKATASIDRLEAAQRLTTRLLTEPQPSTKSPRPAVTPH
jgi:hypothetical protein